MRRAGQPLPRRGDAPANIMGVWRFHFSVENAPDQSPSLRQRRFGALACEIGGWLEKRWDRGKWLSSAEGAGDTRQGRDSRCRRGLAEGNSRTHTTDL